MASLVVQTSFLGDMVLTTPLIAELAKRGPVDVVATPANAGLLANNPDVRNAFVYDKRSKGLTELIHISKRIRRGGVYPSRDSLHSDQGGVNPSPTNVTRAAYLCQGSVRSSIFALLSGYQHRIGFNTSAGKWLYTQRVLYHDDFHHAARLLTLAGINNPTPDQLRPRLYPGDAERAAVEALNISSPFITLAPGSVWATKRWPYFSKLATELSKSFKVVIVGGPQDRVVTNEILAHVPNAINATGKLSLLASAELIGRSAALVTNDSAPQHLASAMNTPTITLFGPTVPEFGFGPLAHNSRTPGHATLPCRPCDRHGPQKCPLGHWRCMRELNVDYVYSAVMDVLNSVNHKGQT